MITENGKTQVKRYLAGQTGEIATCVAIGLGTTAPLSTDTSLAFEFERMSVISVTYDFLNDLLVFKAELDTDLSGVIYEAGIFSLDTNELAGAYSSQNLTIFDGDSEVWTGATFSSVLPRVGDYTLSHTPAASTTTTSTLSDITMDLSGYSAADKLNIAYNCGNTNTSSIVIRFKTDNSNYYSFTINTPPSGYSITSFSKTVAVTTGTPDWSNITTIEVATTSRSTGASAVDMDAIRVEDIDTNNTDYFLVARDLVSPQIVKQSGLVQEIEFSVGVSIS